LVPAGAGFVSGNGDVANHPRGHKGPCGAFVRKTHLVRFSPIPVREVAANALKTHTKE